MPFIVTKLTPAEPKARRRLARRVGPIGRPPSHNGVCTLPECYGKHYAKGYCCKHYYQLVYRRKPIPGNCSVEGCERPRTSKRMCHAHYWRRRRHGNPLLVSDGMVGVKVRSYTRGGAKKAVKRKRYERGTDHPWDQRLTDTKR